ncbi:TonB-dependent receptor [Caenibius sp. WL]|nr:TonB-dependent receptor [Caenibius sp. WL]
MACAFVTLASTISSNALAQSSAVTATAEQNQGVDEIIVTAQKREESLQDTPISIAALSSRALENKGINDITDLRSAVPSLQVTPHPNSSVTARVFIRGVGNNDDQLTADPSVAVYLDGVYVARSQGLASDLANIERIEVLRGPQGSLYGRNATGGAINYITKAPELGEFGGAQTFTLGNYNQFRSRTRLNVPIGDKLAIELGYLHAQKNGFVKNAGTGVKRWGDQRRDAYRAAVHWQPTDTLDVRYAYDRSDINDTPSFVLNVPFYPSVADRPKSGSVFVNDLLPNDVTAQGHNLTLSWELGDDLTLKSITGYRKLHNFSNQNSFTGVLGPFPVTLSRFDQNQKQFTQEVQAIGNLMDGRLEYVLGAYYFRESAHSFDQTSILTQPRTDRAITIKNNAYALYAQATLRPAALEGLYLTGGLRWSRDERRATLQQNRVPSNGPIVVGPRGEGDRNFTNVSPSFVIGYEASKNINIYAKYARGYKTGGYNIRASTIDRFNAGYDPETLNSYEIGLKSELFDRRLRLNLAAYQLDYRDIQTNVQVDPLNPGLTDVFNAGKARIKGIEADITLRPVHALTLGLSYAYLDAKYRKIVDLAGNDITSRYTYVEAPKHTISSNLEYIFPETGAGTPSLYVDYYYQSKKYTATGDPRYIIGDYGLLNARLSLSDIPIGFGKWKLSAFGKNLTGKKYYIAHYQGFVPAAIYGEPRTYGVELSFEF